MTNLNLPGISIVELYTEAAFIVYIMFYFETN